MLIETWPHTGMPVHEYVPVNSKDPLDVEVARVLNSLGHGFKVERTEPPLRRPKEGEEVQAKYSFSTTLGSKNVTLKLTTLNRRGDGEGTKKVMCRVGGGEYMCFWLLAFLMHEAGFSGFWCVVYAV